MIFEETATAFALVELRRYVMRPGRRDELIALFERKFVEPQEASGMIPLGHYRDRDRDESFVWLRGFPDAETRAAALASFYGSPVWRANRNAAN
ncbi:MAG TPA: NIPSNAP family protein, partial [Solirubrobacteraceae bacterium]|nr:NIPSNAP family protein [Solirubrobacteraceae bacterium]